MSGPPKFACHESRTETFHFPSASGTAAVKLFSFVVPTVKRMPLSVFAFTPAMATL